MSDTQRPTGTALLLQAVSGLAMPRAVTKRSSRTALGLHLLSSALRLDHVDRVTERVTLVDATHLARDVEIDVDLTKLSRSKLEALAADADTIWLPIAMHRSSELGPVVLTDGRNEVVPRMPSREASRLIGSGLAELFNLQLNARPGSSDSAAVSRQARWLIEAAILSLVRDGPLTWHSVADEDAAVRQRAAEYVNLVTETRGPDHAFSRLMQAATEDTVVVARIRRDQPVTKVRYQAPELTSPEAPARRPRRTGRSHTSGRDFTLTYQTTIPHDVDSFHVTVKVPEQLELHHLLLFSTADLAATNALVDDIRALATDYRAIHDGLASVAAFEINGITTRLAELGRRRMADLITYQRYLDRQRRRVGVPPVTPAPQHPDGDLTSLLTDVESRPRFVEALSRLAATDAIGHPAPDVGADPDVVEATAVAQDATQLRALAERLVASQVATDLRVDNDPREVAGHVQWRPRDNALGGASPDPVRATVWMSLIDAEPSQARQVLNFLIASVAIVVSAGSVIALSAERANTISFSAADAVVTILLLVPGLLLSRLYLPLRRTVLARVRVLPRILAWLSVTSTTALAVVVATSPARLFPWASGVVCLVLVGLIGISGVDLYRRRQSWRDFAPPYEGLPTWLHELDPRGAVQDLLPTSASFVEG